MNLNRTLEILENKFHKAVINNSAMADEYLRQMQKVAEYMHMKNLTKGSMVVEKSGNDYEKLSR